MTPVVVAGAIGAAALGWMVVRGRRAPRATAATIVAELRLYAGLDQPDDARVWVIVAGARPSVVQVSKAALVADTWTKVATQPQLRTLVATAAEVRVPKASFDEAATELRALLLAQFDPAQWAGAELLFYARQAGGTVVVLDEYLEDVRKQSGQWTGTLNGTDGTTTKPMAPSLGELLEQWFDGMYASAIGMQWGTR